MRFDRRNVRGGNRSIPVPERHGLELLTNGDGSEDVRGKPVCFVQSECMHEFKDVERKRSQSTSETNKIPGPGERHLWLYPERTWDDADRAIGVESHYLAKGLQQY